MVRTTLVICLALVGCGGDPEIRWTGGPEEAQEVAVLVTPNLDDDDYDGDVDWTQLGRVDDEDDRSTVRIDKPGKAASLRFIGDGADVMRVWHEGRLVLGDGGPESWTLPDDAKKDGVELKVEVGGWGRLGDLVLYDKKDEESGRIPVVGSPPTLGHHLLPSGDVWIVGLSFGFDYNNQSMIDDIEAELGDRFFRVEGSTVRNDPWMQDEPEFLRMWSPESSSTLILDSIRDGNGDGGLDPFPESIAGGDVFVQSYGPGVAQATTYDAFGNLEASPPVEVDGTDYPLGRTYYGWNGGSGSQDYGPHPDMRDFLGSTGVQAPFWVDTSWLCVGHIDEVTSFIPDPTAPRGFRFLISDTNLGWAALQERDGGTGLQRHGETGFAGHNRPTIASYVNDAELRAYNQDMQDDHLEPILEAFREELALTDEEIIRIPSVFEEIADQFGVCGAAAVVPGSINLLMYTNEAGDGGTIFLADPFVRAPGEDQDCATTIRTHR